MITLEQVADLQPGDVIRLESLDWPSGTSISGPLELSEYGALLLHLPNKQGSYVIREANGSVLFGPQRTIELISRAPRPLYVNHPRETPAYGDVVRDATGTIRYAVPRTMDRRNGPQWWGSIEEHDGEWLHCSTEFMKKPLTLLWDGETGQVVQ